MRTPDPWLIGNRGRLRTVAQAAGWIGVLVLMLGSRYMWARSLQAPASILAAGAVLGWVIVVNRVTPKVSDYLAHLKRSAEKEGLGDWLARTDAGFMEVCQIERLEEMGREQVLSLERPAALIDEKRPTRTCDTPLRGSMIDMWGPHEDGYHVEGYEEKQWVFVTCHICDYDTALHRIWRELA